MTPRSGLFYWRHLLVSVLAPSLSWSLRLSLRHSVPLLASRLLFRGVPIRCLCQKSSWRMEYNNKEEEDSSNAINHHSKSLRPSYWNVCQTCQGEGRITKPPSRKARMRRKRINSNNSTQLESSLPSRLEPCHVCQSAGLVASLYPQPVNPELPNIAIIGGGIGGFALATACRHRGIPHVVFERDAYFSQRAQGYGLTMQQASKALKGFGIHHLPDGITSTKHIVHKSDGTVVGQWGMRHWQEQKNRQSVGNETKSKEPNTKKKGTRRQNIHIARQALRHHLLETATAHEFVNSDRHASADIHSTVKWNHRLVEYKVLDDDRVELVFQVGEEGHDTVRNVADLVVGADGIRSQVRKQLIGEEKTPLRYLGCFVMLGICPLLSDDEVDLFPQVQGNHLLDGRTVFQTADGTTRIYMMPYSATEYMWQLSFPVPDEEAASALSRRGPQVLKEEAIRLCQSWHSPISEILRATPTALVSGYPVYDRELLSRDHLDDNSGRSRVTLIGDAAHPLSPFKGQGANQALLDALSLARTIYRVANQADQRSKYVDGASNVVNNKSTIIEKALNAYESEMMERSAVKVAASADAAEFLHTEVAIREGNVTRGGASREANAEAQVY